jgi:predicted phage tail component-like protein
MMNDSFVFYAPGSGTGVDLRAQFGIKVIAVRSFTADLRPRKVTVPGRSGAYDYGANYHEERELYFDCMVERELKKDASQGIDEFDDLKYLLCHGTRKGRIIIWDQQDRYYLGRLYQQENVQDFFQLKGRKLTLRFICDPYAYGLEPKILYADNNGIVSMTGGNRYFGTRQTPTRITIRNTGTSNISNIIISAFERRS